MKHLQNGDDTFYLPLIYLGMHLSPLMYALETQRHTFRKIIYLHSKQFLS